MAQFPYNPMQPRKVQRARPRRKARFKWGIVLVPGVILLALWLASGVSIGFSFNDVMDALSVHDRRRYRELCILGMVAVGIVSIAKILRKDNDKSEEK